MMSSMCSMPTLRRNHLRLDAGLALLVGRHLPMRGRSRMAGQRLGVTHIDQPLEQLQRVVKILRRLEPADDTEGQQRAGAAAEIFLRQLMIGIVGEAGVIDPGHAAVLTQKFGDAAGVFDVALDAQRHRLDALQQQKRGQRRQHGAGGALIDAAAARDIGAGAEMLRVDQTVVRRVALVEHRKALLVRRPGKAAAVDDGAAERGAVAAHELGQRVNDDVGAVFDRAQQDRRRHRIVDDQRNAVPRADLCQRLDVADVARRIADALAEDGTGAVVDQLFDCPGLIGLREAHLDPLARQQVGEQRVGGAVELRHRDDIAAHAGDIEHRIVQRRLPGGYAQRFDAAFERGDATFQDLGGRIADARIAVAFDLEVEQSCAMVGAVEFISDGLVDRHRDGFRRRIGVVAAVHGHRFSFHIVPPRIPNAGPLYGASVSYPWLPT